jgi:tRNA-dihydrouridine synthase 3
MGDQIPDPLDSEGGLKRQLEEERPEDIHPSQPTTTGDPMVTTTETAEGNGIHEPASKRVKIDQSEQTPRVDARDKVRGIALIKPE